MYFVTCWRVFGIIYIVFLQIIENTKEFKQKLKDSITRKSDLFKNGDLGTDKVWSIPFLKFQYSFS